MEHLPPRSPDEEPRGPENEQLWPGEIDLTGTTRQDDALADVIGDAVAEAEDGGEIPDWGARTLARALANVRDDPFSGALHHFAVTGRADPEPMVRELADLYQTTTDEQIREWINWLGTYVIRLPSQTAERPNTDQAQGSGPTTSDEVAHTDLRHIFREADARGEPINNDDAQAVAHLLSVFLYTDSEMARFASTGDADPSRLHEECQEIRRRAEHVPGAGTWITRFEQHLASRSDLGRQSHPPSSSEPAGHSERGGHDDLAAEGLEALVFGDQLDVVRAYLNMTFARADARGESISEDSARYLAKLLAAVLGSDSAMSRFAESGECDLRDLQQECRQLASQQWPTADITAWAHRFEQYVASSPPPTPSPTPEAPTERDSPPIDQGIRERRQAPPPAVADALARAEQDGLSEQAARDIARLLAPHPEATTEALRDYGATGTLAHDKAIRELFDVYVAGDDQAQELVRALGSHLIWQAIEAEMLQGTTEPGSAPRHHATFDPANFRLVLGLEAHGHAFVAYLQLHDVDPHDDGLLRSFQDTYLGSYGTLSELVQAFRAMLIDVGEWDDRDPALDDVTLMQFARRAWDIVDVGDRFYVFHK